jgi:hypothetical protein
LSIVTVGTSGVTLFIKSSHLGSFLTLLELSLIAIGIVSPMKLIIAVPLLAGLAAAHSGVWQVEVDGNVYD